MEGSKLFYVFADPLGARDCKIGITGHPHVRLGSYQNSYSRNSHVACFDLVYVGPRKAVESLEKALKQELDWDIERDGRGASEWISGQSVDEIAARVDEVIEGYRFKIRKIPKKYLPLTVDNLPQVLDYLQQEV